MLWKGRVGMKAATKSMLSVVTGVCFEEDQREASLRICLMSLPENWWCRSTMEEISLLCGRMIGLRES